MARFLSFILFNGLLVLSLSGQAERPAESDYQSAPPLAEEAESVSSGIPYVESAPPVTVTEVSEENSEQTIVQSGNIVTMDDKTQVPVKILDFPTRGMTMDKVINEMGQPLNKFPAVGKPPITRWDYPDRTVFFEYSSVIHVVAK